MAKLLESKLLGRRWTDTDCGSVDTYDSLGRGPLPLSLTQFGFYGEEETTTLGTGSCAAYNVTVHCAEQALLLLVCSGKKVLKIEYLVSSSS